MTKLRGKIVELFKVARQEGALVKWGILADGKLDADQILALIKEAGYISPEEQIDANAQLEYWHDRLEAKIEEAKKQLLEKVEKQIWRSGYIVPDNKQKVINGIRQALKEKGGENGR